MTKILSLALDVWVLETLTLVLLEGHASIDRRSVRHLVRLDGLEGELIALPSPRLLVRGAVASIVDLTAGPTVPVLGHRERRSGVTDGHLIPIPCRRSIHAVQSCG